MKKPINLVWLKRDLRLTDHQPLWNAFNFPEDALILYIFEPLVEFSYDFDYRHWRFVYESLIQMKREVPISFFYGSSEEVFQYLCEEFEVKNVFSHQETGISATYERDKRVAKFFHSRNILWKEFQSNGVVRGLRNRDTWDAQWIKWMTSPIEKIKIPKNKIQALEVHPFVLPQDLKSKISENFLDKAGAETAHTRLNEFLSEKVENYWNNLSYPDKSRYHCSRLSPYISWGNISVREIYQACHSQRAKVKNKKSLDQFMARLKWHCHFIQKLEMETEIEFENLNPAFNHLRTKVDKTLLKAWKKGQTGYPLIDAAMRCVEQTGYLNFRLRATVVSFLTHLLWQPWQPGARHLARMFLDYEPGIHFSQFQMQAGTTGINSIRIYNPIKQSLEKDSEGLFIKKWIPELKDLPLEFVHCPWLMTSMDEILYDFKLGRDYPKPIIEFDIAYKKAQESLWKTKNGEQTKKHSQIILRKHARSKKSNSKT